MTNHYIICQSHILPMGTTLHLREKAFAFTDDFTIREINTDQIYFKLQGAGFSMSQRKALLDPNNVPIVHMRNEMFTWRPTFNIFADAESKKKLFTITTKHMTFETVMEVEFREVTTGRQCLLRLEGSSTARAAIIYLDTGKGQPQAVGRIYRPSTGRSIAFGAQDYYLDIAPNVDMALLVLLCIAVDEAKKD
jgi:uncharacterized protein YxjI